MNFDSLKRKLQETASSQWARRGRSDLQNWDAFVVSPVLPVGWPSSGTRLMHLCPVCYAVIIFRVFVFPTKFEPQSGNIMVGSPFSQLDIEGEGKIMAEALTPKDISTMPPHAPAHDSPAVKLRDSAEAKVLALLFTHLPFTIHIISGAAPAALAPEVRQFYVEWFRGHVPILRHLRSLATHRAFIDWVNSGGELTSVL